ncbi:hypothetical protein PYCCODRAFT_1431825 [Trametes coccinea BRFM310]|uniref:Uncharacterized protein n=1 Tax=Trametes coccinea (strain BRFM310) TaxID=1353009 RepID=A0A1Y2IY11_TRAC3|nr:hypothetical protein PYCCODRAFT_1431825 [Trametes coccinea BRFM310]
MRLFHQDTEAWEVVDSKAVEPIPVYSEDELQGMQVTRVYSTTMHRTYMFDMKHAADLPSAVVFARSKLLQEAAEKEYNIFISEGWSVTHLRKGKDHRVEVRYTARPASVSSKDIPTRDPPFLAILGKSD